MNFKEWSEVNPEGNIVGLTVKKPSGDIRVIRFTWNVPDKSQVGLLLLTQEQWERHINGKGMVAMLPEFVDKEEFLYKWEIINES